MILSEVVVEMVRPEEEGRFRELMQSHHYLGAMPKIGETLWYVAHGGRHVACPGGVFGAGPEVPGAPTLGLAGISVISMYAFILSPTTARLLILPGHHYRNLGSRFLGLCARRIVGDWPARFGHPLLLLETFVDPARFQGTVYRAANWQAVGHSRGFRRGGAGYCELSTPKRVFLYPLARNVGQQLSGAALNPTLRKGAPKIMLSADHIRSLPDVFRDIDDPRTRKGRRHSLHSTLALATAATLCGARGYKAIWEWIDDLGQKALARFEVRRRNGVRKPPCQSTIRTILMSVDPAQLDRALQRWHQQHGGDDVALAIDGKTLRNAIDEHGTQVHVMSVVGHDTKSTYTQKKSA